MTRTRVVFDARGEVMHYDLWPPRERVFSLTDDEDLELRALCGIAWETRERRDYEAVVDWHDRRFVRRHERRQNCNRRVAQVLRGN